MPESFAVIYLKFKQRSQTFKGILSKWCKWNSIQCRLRSDCSSRSSLILVCTVCPDLSAGKLRVITVNALADLQIVVCLGIKQLSNDQAPMDFGLVWVEALRPSQQFFSHVRTEPPLPGYYQYFLGGKCILL